MVHPLPPSLADQTPRPIDEKLWTYTARRPVGEWVFANAARKIAVDPARFAEMEALREGHNAPSPADELSRGILSLFSVLVATPDLFRAGLEYIGTVTTVQQILRWPEVAEGIRAAQEAP